MFLYTKKYILITISFLTLILSSTNDDLFYNYYILNGSPSTNEFNDLLKSKYETDLIHYLEKDNISAVPFHNYENFLNSYYKQYKRENLKFVNAIVEPDIFYISGFIGTSNIIVGKNNYMFGQNIGFHIDTPYAFKVFKKTVVIGLKASSISLPPSNNSNWDNFRSINMASTYSMKFGKRIYVLTGVGATSNSSNSKTTILPLTSLDLAYELPWKPLNIPFDITICNSIAWDLKNIHIGFNILLCKPYRINFTDSK